MTIHFNADEILALAERIERGGAAFYARAAKIADNPDTRKELEQLAEWEAAHEKLFSSLRAALASQEKQPPGPDPEDETLLYLNAMAARHILNRHEDLGKLFTGKESVDELLEIAIGFERDSIALFEGLEAWVPVALGKTKVRRLIEEEMGHVAHLERERLRIAAE